ncbi:arsenite-transporting ATPase [Atopostipes suicloacalis DSM 15692]|uniref:Arsenite-transporting ATPase n=1 Tax=Atopostipes suicloacalis DSM 15692 TaxID=1121025 RepID=A0A1M4SA32_9LACT|nr:arsenical pump-driving ATPase [Atopostipes suicloacalis]SHE29028.1 arsenite-transporting ATPase [Atopostipes suicloacalis DSM 15692]
MEIFNPKEHINTKYLFYTGKGGVGKTTAASATAIQLANDGFKVVLVSTDPASNLQDVFERELDDNGTEIEEIPGLTVANFDPVSAAEEYKESIVGPYRGILPDAAVQNMEEQLSGSCTTEIASFDQFAKFLTSPDISDQYDYIIFDTAPTGHTLRLLQLPSAWTNFFDENTTGTSCMGQLSGLDEERESYSLAVETLANSEMTTLLLVTRPQEGPLVEANRASEELRALGVENQKLIVNGLLENPTDTISQTYYDIQQEALSEMPENLKNLPTFEIPLRPYNLASIESIGLLLSEEQPEIKHEEVQAQEFPRLQTVIDDLYNTNKRVVFTMGKGGVGKTTIAASIAKGLVEKGKKVHLTTTDPAAHLNYIVHESDTLGVSHIDEKKELELYQNEVLAKARESMSEEDLAYVEEDLNSPCTEEIAVFRKFAEIVSMTEADVVVIDTAPTGHTLLLLESSQSYAQEVERTSGEVPESITRLLPILQDHNQTEVVMVTLPENTPVYESIRLQEDLDRAGIAHTWWVVNNSLLSTGTTNETLLARAKSEEEWIQRVDGLSNGHFAVIDWSPFELKEDVLATIV